MSAIIAAIIVALLALIVSLYLTRTKTTEVTTAEGLTNLLACPAGLKEYSTNDAVNCCEGEVLGGKCQGKPKCTLSAKSGALPHCSAYYETYMAERARRNCPASMPRYYEINGRGYCTSSQLKSDGSGPLDTTGAKFCKVLATPEERYSDPESCLNVRRLDEMKVTTSGQEKVTKNIIVDKQGKPVLLTATITKGLESRSCYDRNTAEIYLDAVVPQWRSDPVWQKTIAYYEKTSVFCA